MLRKSEILVILNSKQKSLCQLATTEFFPKETKNRETERKLQNRLLGPMPRISGSQPLKLVVLSHSNKSVEILSNFQNVKPLRNCNTPY